MLDTFAINILSKLVSFPASSCLGFCHVQYVHGELDRGRGLRMVHTDEQYRYNNKDITKTVLLLKELLRTGRQWFGYFPNDLNLKSYLHQFLVIKNQSPIKTEHRFQHAAENTCVI